MDKICKLILQHCPTKQPTLVLDQQSKLILLTKQQSKLILLTKQPTLVLDQQSKLILLTKQPTLVLDQQSNPRTRHPHKIISAPTSLVQSGLPRH